jgi:hypothetical protein
MRLSLLETVALDSYFGTCSLLLAFHFGKTPCDMGMLWLNLERLLKGRNGFGELPSRQT